MNLARIYAIAFGVVYNGRLVYFAGDLLPLGPTDNSLASLSQMFGYSAYALLPVTIATGIASLVGIAVSAIRRA